MQLLSVVHAAGSSTLRSSTSTAGVGGGGGDLGVAVAASTTRGRQVTDLARRAAPPVRKRDPSTLVVVFWSAFATFLVLGMASDDPGFALAGLVVGGGIAYLALRGPHRERADDNAKEYAAAMREWNHSVMCLRCGVITAPPAEAERRVLQLRAA